MSNKLLDMVKVRINELEVIVEEFFLDVVKKKCG